MYASFKIVDRGKLITIPSRRLYDLSMRALRFSRRSSNVHSLQNLESSNKEPTNHTWASLSLHG
jgi:hypothetical protein